MTETTTDSESETYRYSNRFWHLCDTPAGKKNSVQKALSRMANSRNGVRDQGLVHMVKHGHPKLVGWAGFVVKQGATTIREDSAVTRVAFIA